MLRFLIEKGILKVRPGDPTPWASFSANFAGCFALGVLPESLIVRGLPASYYVLLSGSITMFSIVSLQLLELTRDRLYSMAGLRAFTGWLVGTGAAVAGVAVSLH